MMFELITVINIAMASFMVGNDYQEIVKYQESHQVVAEAYVYDYEEVDEDDGVLDLES